jgi:hypothetical protein
MAAVSAGGSTLKKSAPVSPAAKTYNGDSTIKIKTTMNLNFFSIIPRIAVCFPCKYLKNFPGIISIL